MGIIQQNAMRSWLRLVPRPEVILFGNEADTADMARRLGVRHVGGVASNSYGTPLVSDMFRQADSLAAGDMVAFVSADVILTQSLVRAATIASRWSSRFLLVAQRRDVDVRALIEFDPDFENRWIPDTVASSRLHSPGAVDLFLYPRGQYGHMPPFAIGRTSYDNWLLWNTMASGIPLIDATDYVTLIHQNHAYSHAPNVDVWNGVEARENRRWIKDWTNYYTIAHADWKLDRAGQIVRASGWKYRLARPRQLLSHAFRSTRWLRTRMRTWQTAQRYGE